MPIPTSIDDLSTTAGSNSPSGSDTPTDGDNFLRAHASFIAELRDSRDNLADAADAAKGGALVGFLRTLSYTGNTVGRWLKWLFTREVDVTSYATGGTGTSGDPYTGWDTAITWTNRTTYKFGDGFYSYATSPAWGVEGLKLIGTGNTQLVHTGSGYAMSFDGGAAGDGVYKIGVSGIKVRSNSGASGGVYIRAVHHSDFQIDAVDIPSTVFTTRWAVASRYKFRYTALVDGHTVIPTKGMDLGERGSGETTTASTFDVPIINNVNGIGFHLTACDHCTFLSGASEANVGDGLQIDLASNNNTFVSTDFESNGTSIDCDGPRNTFINVFCTDACDFGSGENSVIGGTFDAITDSGTSNRFTDCGYSQASGSFTANSTTVKRNVMNVTTNTLDRDLVANGMGISKAFIRKKVDVTFGSSITIDVSTGNDFLINATSSTAVAIQAPTNSAEGQEITITVRNNSGGALGTFTWSGAFKMASWTNPANGFSRSITFYRDDTISAAWIEKSRTTSDIPN